MAISKQAHETEVEELEDWSLTTKQMLFMLQRHNAIESAFKHEANDRYETMLEATLSLLSPPVA